MIGIFWTRYGIWLVVGTLARLRSIGVRIAIDDFGTGYASLRYLHLFPADIVKIDRTYVQDLARDPAAVRVVGTLWQLFGAIGLTAVAEGIEDPAQAAMLIELGCPVGQGFLYGRPGALSALPVDLVSVETGHRRVAADDGRELGPGGDLVDVGEAVRGPLRE